MTLTIIKFTKTKTEIWNEFVNLSKNGLFLFNRSYMEYHEERFVDHSLMIYSSEKLIALLPANEKDQVIYSHAGLTFGGLIFQTELRAADVLQVFESIVEYYRNLSFTSFLYKAIPYIFHRLPAQEDLYALTRNKAELYRRDISSAIELSNPIRFSETKRQAINKCKQAGIVVKEQENVGEYWSLLETVLDKFSAKPVHSIDEMSLLKSKFPSNIRLFEARQEDKLLAGILIYDYGQVAHTQYMANSTLGRKLGALDFINHFLISEEFKDRKYYSFGVSTESDGTYLNEGLIQQKEMMGGRGIVHDFYKILLT